MHRLFFIFVVFSAESLGWLQAALLMLITVLFLVYLARARPFTSSVDFFLNLISCLALVLLYLLSLLFSLLPLESLSLRLALGYFFIALVVLLFVLSVLTILLSKMHLFVLHCRRRKERKLLRLRKGPE